MTAKDLLNADMTTVSRWLREGFQWWLSEIVELAPKKWRGSLIRGTGATAEMHGNEIVLAEGAASSRSLTLVLPPSAALMREVELPVVAGNDARRMIALDIDRLTPFHANDVLFDTAAIERDAGDGRQSVLVAAIARVTVEDVLARARGQSLEPKAIIVQTPGGHSFDFLAALRRTNPGSAKRTAMWWAMAGGFAAANIFVLIFSDQSSLDELRDAVDSQRATVAVAERLRRKVDTEAMRRIAVMDRTQHTPLAALAAVTTALPDTAWVQRFEWTGERVRITGFQKGTENVAALLKASHEFANPRASGASSEPVYGATRAFDVAADVARLGKPPVRR